MEATITTTATGERRKASPHQRRSIDREAELLYSSLGRLGWALEECALYAPLTLEIRRLKEKMGATILAHSYQVPEILYGIADFRGDSLQLSQEAKKTEAEVIVFCGVRFMAETAKILSPEKTVLLPAPDAGCSLDESITAEDVRRLKQKYPDAAVVCYVNTRAAVKAESTVCCTSANGLAVVEGRPEKRIIFVPDLLMARNIQAQTKKEIIPWRGTCIVHEAFTLDRMVAFREHYPDLEVLVHTECSPEVTGAADLAGGTGDMIRHIRNSSARQFMLVTECGLADRLRVEFPGREFIGSCVLCPHMKRTELRNVLEVLEDPSPDQIIEIPAEIRHRAERALTRMLEYH